MVQIDAFEKHAGLFIRAQVVADVPQSDGVFGDFGQEAVQGEAAFVLLPIHKFDESNGIISITYPQSCTVKTDSLIPILSD